MSILEFTIFAIISGLIIAGIISVALAQDLHN